MYKDVLQIIKWVPKDDKQEIILYLEKHINELKKIKDLSYIEKQEIYKLFEDLILELRTKFFPFKRISEIEPVFQHLINLHIDLLVDLKKQWIENYFDMFKWTWEYWILKALSTFRFADNINRLSDFLLNRSSKVFNYLYNAYQLEKDDELVFKIFKQFISRLFSTPEYVSEQSRKQVIQNLVKDDNFKFFYEIEKYKKYIERNIFDEELDLKELKQEIGREKIDLSDFRIWLIFWSRKSVKAFKNYKKKQKALDFIRELWLKDFDTNFEILETDFKKQKNLNVNVIKNRLFGIWDKLDIILCFELDHKTNFYDNLLNDQDIGWRIILNTKEVTGSNQSGQHFSIEKFKKMLKKGIDNYLTNTSWDLNLSDIWKKATNNDIDFDINWREKHRIFSKNFEWYFIDYYTDEKGKYTPLGKLVHDIKYTDLSEEQINLKIKEILKYIPDIKKLFWKVDLIIPVPFSIDRKVQPVYVLSKKISKKFNIPVYDNVLIKWKQTKPLKDLTKNERIEEISWAFIIENKNLLNWKDILIFDDIYDSWITINEICNVLREKANINKIYVLTLTKTRKECALSYKV